MKFCQLVFELHLPQNFCHRQVDNFQKQSNRVQNIPKSEIHEKPEVENFHENDTSTYLEESLKKYTCLLQFCNGYLSFYSSVIIFWNMTTVLDRLSTYFLLLRLTQSLHDRMVSALGISSFVEDKRTSGIDSHAALA